MRRQTFDIHLESEIAVGTPGSVTGGRDSIDYLPGSLLLGAAAAQLYRDLGDAAWDVFHSGKVRFGDGLPVAPSGLCAWPTPLCLGAPKGTRSDDADFAVVNFAVTGRQAGYDKLGEPYLSAAGELVRPTTFYRLKTAIDPRSGVSMARQLYGYHSLASGQVFRAELCADDDLPESVFARLVDALSGQVRLGRSRSAEYGRCRVVPVTPAQADAREQTQAARATGDGLVTVLLLSHLAVDDAGGVPSALPRSTALGLPEGEPVPERCFVRHARHAVYNAAYRAFEADYTVMVRGSVLCYRFDAATAAAVTAVPERYAGLLQQRGLGRLLLNPAFLIDATPAFQTVPAQRAAEALVKPESLLLDWLESRRDTSKIETQVRRKAEAWYGELAELYRSARVRGGFSATALIGPSPAQWGRIAEAVGRETAGVVDLARLEHALFDANVGICRAGDPDWGVAVLDEALEKALERPPTFKDWLRHKLETPVAGEDGVLLDETRRVAVLAHFARFAADRAKQQRNVTEVHHEQV